MSFFLLIKRSISGLAVLMLFSGCSASSSSHRYKEHKDEKEKYISRYADLKGSDIDSSASVTDADNPDSTKEFDDPPPPGTNSLKKLKIGENLGKLNNADESITPREKMLLEVIKYLDTPYKYGGNSGKGIDCSAFTMQIYKNSLDIQLPRSTKEQYRLGDSVSKDELKFGDLVFFNTRRRSNPGHVGIYIGENQFVHASRKLGVTVSSLDEIYYKRRFTAAKRVDEIER
jgi:cell wall-associated NlpC family hydrolase